MITTRCRSTGRGNGPDVFDRDARPAVERGPGLRRQDQRLAGTRAGPPGDPIADVLWSAMCRPARGPHQIHCVVNALVRDRHAPHQVLQGADPLARNQRADLFLVGSCREPVDSSFFVGSRIADEDLEQEAVKLRLGQGIGPLLFDRVLRGQDKEGVRQPVAVAADGHLPFLHCLQERRLSFRRRPVDLVGQDQVGKDRPVDKPELAGTAGSVFVQNLGAGDIAGHQVGRELDPVEIQRERLCQGVDHERLGQSRNALQDAMPAGKDSDQKLIDDFVLTHDLPRDLPADLRVGGLQLVQFGEVEFVGRGAQNHILYLLFSAGRPVDI